MDSTTAENVVFDQTCYLGIELGSTRIKAVLIDEHHHVLAQGTHDWENQMVQGVWTYSLEQVIEGLQACYRDLKQEVQKHYHSTLNSINGIGISAMMHGFLVFDQQDTLLTPFRTWRNTMTQTASEELTKLFHYPIPQRWSIAHLYQAILNQESYVSDIHFQTTLAGYVHYLLTGKKVVGIGEASGMFPIDSVTGTFNQTMMDHFDQFISNKNYDWKLNDILPCVLRAGEDAGYLTTVGARLLDPEGDLQEGCPLCPPEGDAGTGMVATNSIKERSGNVSAGTSVFAMVVLEKELSKVYEAIDYVTTPVGDLVAMVHCNNGTSELSAWIGLFQELLQLTNHNIDTNVLYERLFQHALTGQRDGGGLVACNYLSGEHITQFASGIPLFMRKPEGNFTLANFMLTQLYSALSTLKIGMDLLIKEEHVVLEQMIGHGGFFKTPKVGQMIMSAAMHAPVSVMETAGEGGAWGCAVLASYRVNANRYSSLETYLTENVFANTQMITIKATKELQQGFDAYLEEYQRCLQVERSAVSTIS